jgi:hypothetical protein
MVSTETAIAHQLLIVNAENMRLQAPFELTMGSSIWYHRNMAARHWWVFS